MVNSHGPPRAFWPIYDLSIMKGARAFDWRGTVAENSLLSTQLGHSETNSWASYCGWVLDVKLLQGLIVEAKLQGMTEPPLIPIGEVAKVGRVWWKFRFRFQDAYLFASPLARSWQV